MCGISGASAEGWQRAMGAPFKHPGIQVFYDGVKIASRDPVTQLERLKFFFSVEITRLKRMKSETLLR